MKRPATGIRLIPLLLTVILLTLGMTSTALAENKFYFDKTYNVLCINPGAAGNYGFHSVRTAIRFDLTNGTPTNLEVWERQR